jgi:hypothetical protein
MVSAAARVIGEAPAATIADTIIRAASMAILEPRLGGVASKCLQGTIDIISRAFAGEPANRVKLRRLRSSDLIQVNPDILRHGNLPAGS